MATENNTTDQEIDLESMQFQEFSDQLLASLEGEEQPTLTLDQMDQIERQWENLKIARRCLLIWGTKPWKEIAESIQEDHELAIAAAASVSCDHLEFYKWLPELIESTKMRLMVALCCREDAKEIMEKGKQGIQH